MTSPLDKFRQELFNELQAQDVSGEKPLRDAFEVEDCTDHKNFVFVLRETTVDLFDSSRGMDKRLLQTFGPNEFPFGHATAIDYYVFVFQKSLRADDNICFLGYVEERKHRFAPLEVDTELDVEEAKDESIWPHDDPYIDIGGEGGP